MKRLLIILFIQALRAHELDTSVESNKIDNAYAPVFDKIIFNDVLDVLNEFDTKGTFPFENFLKDDSDSYEDIEDLLNEYQRYIEKKLVPRGANPFANLLNQNLNAKNTDRMDIPVINGENMMPSPPGYEYLFYPNQLYNPQDIRFMETNYNNPDFYPRFRSKVFELEDATSRPKLTLLTKINSKKVTIGDPKAESRKAATDDCVCRADRLPGCKRCGVTSKTQSHDSQIVNVQNPISRLTFPILRNGMVVDGEKVNNKNQFTSVTKYQDTNAVNVIVKVEIQVPQVENITTEQSDDNSARMEPTTLNLPLVNFPIPMEIFGVQVPNKHNHKMSNMHKKKKSKQNSRKNRRKLVTFHNIKVEAFPQVISKFNASKENRTVLNQGVHGSTDTPRDITLNSSIVNPGKSVTFSEIYNGSIVGNTSTTLPILKNDLIDNTVKESSANTTNNDLSLKQSSENTLYGTDNSNSSHSNNTSSKSPITRVRRNVIEKLNNTHVKKVDKSLLYDNDILYWPSNSETVNNSSNKKNITTLIEEHELTKPKINISKELIRFNHTKVLEAVVFGDVDWKDTETIVPRLISFIGKYLRGVLTLCCEKYCHSIKCAEKSCIYRTCNPEQRYNNNGHCVGSNTDSVASLESIMDLPSQIVFETIDILQERLQSKLYGKATLCINSKCLTMTANKKTFVKYKCPVKELNTLGHCFTNKNLKVL